MSYEFVFEEGFRRGLREDTRAVVNSQVLQRCNNLSATKYGLKPMRDIRQPITDAALTAAGITKNYPWPQLFRGRYQTLLVDRTGLYSVTEVPSGTWTISAVTVYDWTTYDFDADTATSDNIDAGGEWHFADFGSSWYLYNGVNVVFKTPFSSKVFIQDEVTIKSGCVYNDGRLITCGFSTDAYALANWPTYLAGFHTNISAEILARSSMALGNNWVKWSAIGGDDILDLYSLNYMKYKTLSATHNQGFTDADPFWLSVQMRNESGCGPMPWTGYANKVMQLGNVVMVYGDYGVHTLVPRYTEAAQTFGTQEVGGFALNCGVAKGTQTRAAAGGSEQIQAFVDSQRDLWIVTPTGDGAKAERLGYRGRFSGLDNLLVHYDATEREFHFTAESVCYRLSENGGLYRAPHIPTTVAFGPVSNTYSPIGIYESDADPTTALFLTEAFNGDRQLRVPNVVRVTVVTGSDEDSGWQLALYFKRTVDDDWQATTLVDVDNRNSVLFNVSGIAFKVYGQHANRATASLEKLIVELDDGERRSIKKWQT